jgi:hypothetical protein
MPSDYFIQSRERGKVGQKFVADMLRSWGYEVDEVKDGYFPGYDLKLGTGRTLEIKTDFQAHRTGNVALELEALFHSRADLLAIVINDTKTVYLSPLQPVLQLANEWPRKIKGGEFNLDIALVPIKTYIERINPEILGLQQDS